MKFLSFLIFMVITCHPLRTPDVLSMICPVSGKEDCTTREMDGLTVTFTSALSTRTKDKQHIGIFCDIVNKSTDTVLFSRKHFRIHSAATAFLQEPFSKMDYNKTVLKDYSDPLKIPPQSSFKNYVLTYKSVNSFTNKEYKAAIYSDTIKLWYQSHAALALQLIATDE